MLHLCATLAAAALLAAPVPEPALLSGTGSSTGGMRALAEAWSRAHPTEPVRVLPSVGSSGAIRAVLDGKLQLGCVARPLTAEEAARGATQRAYARTPLVFATDLGNPLKAITLKEIERIYAGERTAWPDGRPIRLVLRPPTDAMSAALAALSPGLKAGLEKARLVPGLFVGVTDQDAAEHLERTQGAFGPTTWSLVVAEGRRVNVLAVDGAHPSAATGYPWTVELSFVWRGVQPPEAVRGFLAFAASEEGARILAASGHLPVAGKGAR